MNFALSDDQQNTRDAVLKHCSCFSAENRLEHRRFSDRFYAAMAEAGFLGIAMLKSLGGSRLGITEAAMVIQAVAEAGCGMTAAEALRSFEDKICRRRVPRLRDRRRWSSGGFSRRSLLQHFEPETYLGIARTRYLRS